MRHERRLFLAALFGAFIAFAALSVSAVAQEKKPPTETDIFFKKAEPPRLRIEISAEDVAKLKAEPRNYVKCTITENDKTVYKDVAVKLKGAAGSMRDFDDKPAFTLNVDKFEKEQVFHGMKKFHLNNSVQDASFMHEFIASELFQMSGHPAVRITHARVWVNGRDVGLYVLKEPFDKSFIARFFKDNSGNLYDGGFCQDLDADLEKDSGKGPDDKSDIKAIVAACNEPDSKERFKKLGDLVDVKAMLNFVAMEMMIGHWDGYSLNRNNYRLYFDPTTKKAVFIPHGMDQIFGDAGATILEHPGAIVASTVMKNPEWRKAYRKRVNELLPILTGVDKIQKKIDDEYNRFRPIVEKTMPAEFARDLAQQVKGLKDRIAQRARNLKDQADEPEPKPLHFAGFGATMKMVGWRKMSECEDAEVVEVSLPGEKALAIKTGKSGNCIASWRKTVLLSKGKYRFSAVVTTKDVEAITLPDGAACGVRVTGQSRDKQLTGSNTKKPLTFDFEVTDDTQNVELIAELRATRGQAFFTADSMQLKRL